MSPFELGRVLYEARIREAWSFRKGHAEHVLADRPYPRHAADPDPRTQSAEVDLAIAQAKALLKVCAVAHLPAESGLSGRPGHTAEGTETRDEL